ncbi:MAG: hypothetical protein KF826_08730 [Xanthobacteraceae bacterium]|nr:hypothetical protein [Xanthobacteraceae bacterium]MBX3548549.1 hypothetical protein [Xanthobacteraceae bacterium]MCW5678287.1 hypothetical protein [Xanthobacteraceae bacterium]
MPLWNKLFPSDRGYIPSPTVEYRINRHDFDVEGLQEVLAFVIEAIREERTRLEIANSYADDGAEADMVWPEAA